MLTYPYVGEIIFSDETSVWLFDNNHECWFHKNSQHELSVDKHYGKIHVFAAVSAEVGKIVSSTFDRNLNAGYLVELLKNDLIPQGDHFYPEGWVLAHDNAPTFTAQLTQRFLQTTSPLILDWPAKSPDLNPIENVWHLLKAAVRKRLPKTKQDLEEIIWNEWENLKDEVIQRICGSFIDRMNKCIEVNGNQVKL